MITINNSIFDAQGANNKDSVYGITLSGSEDVMIKDCTFSNKGYSSILNNSTGNVTIDNCVFDCTNVYNPIEGSQAVDNGNVTVKDCSFNNVPGNNYINFYQVKENSNHVISNCSFEPSLGTNIVRISNRTSVPMNLEVNDCEYSYPEGTPSSYTAFLLCQDYTSKSGVKQDFSGVAVILDNVKCNNVKITSEGPAVGKTFYVYEDGKGIITDNNPKVTVK